MCDTKSVANNNDILPPTTDREPPGSEGKAGEGDVLRPTLVFSTHQTEWYAARLSKSSGNGKPDLELVSPAAANFF